MREGSRISCCASGEARVDGTRVPRFGRINNEDLAQKQRKKESRPTRPRARSPGRCATDELIREALQRSRGTGIRIASDVARGRLK